MCIHFSHISERAVRALAQLQCHGSEQTSLPITPTFSTGFIAQIRSYYIKHFSFIVVVPLVMGLVGRKKLEATDIYSFVFNEIKWFNRDKKAGGISLKKKKEREDLQPIC